LVSCTKKNLATLLVNTSGSKQDKVWRLNAFIFWWSHRSNASAEYNTWRNYLDRWNSKIDNNNNNISNSEILVTP
jgi:hypothetical protein